MMKGWREGDDKVKGPMFPRLHINDAEKSGPRPPPRNKMALYEQLSVPSQRLNLAATTVVASSSSSPPPPPSPSLLHRPAGAVTSATSSRVGDFGFERIPFPSLHMNPTSALSAEKAHSDGNNMQTTKIDIERLYTTLTNHGASNAASVAECSAASTHGSSKSKKPSNKMMDNTRSPTSLQPGLAGCSKKDTHVTSLLKPCGDSIENDKTSEMESGVIGRNHSLKKPKVTSRVMENNKVEFISHLECGNTTSGTSNNPRGSFEREGTYELSVENSIHGVNADGQGEHCGVPLESTVENEDVPAITKVSTPRAVSVHGYCRSSETADTHNMEPDKNGTGSQEHAHADKNEEDASMVCSISQLEISSGAVAEVFGGESQFWEARRRLMDQQKAFSSQVFELHRLIKVQKLIAASPDVLVESNSFMSKSQHKFSPGSMLIDEAQLKGYRQRDDPHRSCQRAECPEDDDKARFTVPSQCEDVPGKGPDDRLRRPALGFANPPTPTAPDGRTNAWCYHPPNQWLVPVMSPSEGFIYKPYSGPYAPLGSFLAPPLYGGCAPLSLPHVAGDVAGQPRSSLAPPPYQQPHMGVFTGPAAAPSYYTHPFRLPDADERACSLGGGGSRLRLGHTEQSSCDVSYPRSEAFSLRAAKDGGELQGSTASSPSSDKGGRGEVLPLFPMASAADENPASQGSAAPCRVIRVVPRNARYASASAARIFRSIQEERQQLEEDA